MRILEVDQWTSTGNIAELQFDQVSHAAIYGGDSEAVRAIFGGVFQFKEISPDAMPPIARVWFTAGPDGRCKLYRANYDTSD